MNKTSLWLLTGFMTFTSLANESYSVPAIIYAKQKVNVANEHGGRLTFVLLQGKSFKKGEILVSIDSEFEQKQLGLLLSQQKNMKAKIALQQSRIDDYNNLVNQNVMADDTRKQQLMDLYDSKVALDLLAQKILRLQFVIAKKNIIAPFDGVVTANHALAHEVVQVSQPLLTILNPTSLHVRAKVPATIIAKLDWQSAFESVNGEKNRLQPDYRMALIEEQSNTVELSYRADVTRHTSGQYITLHLNKL
ncbi:efflux RND transporter periplasmic adaptor subunit [Alteromonas stellipolaris]|uniref:efflux RND transporter periplasmic adaptor subunit n=1 Tax=Alteromonas stellipolaris TaxID=233316 RepID=UPI001D709B78|nr:HlyD family efflux transporter periplasmic adaptor subunit [Alteromonas stellipolaris]MBZ2163251.1 HlyD family efflux transporter periplasmic adaptor subunit [Alteromonas stellipolaris]